MFPLLSRKGAADGSGHALLWVNRGLFVGLLCIIAAYYRYRLQIGFVVQGGFWLAVFLFVFAPGYALVDGCRLDCAGVKEKTALSLLAGYLVFHCLYFLLAWSGFLLLLPWLCAAALLYYLITLYRRYRGRLICALLFCLDGFAAPFAFIALGLFALILFTYFPVPFWQVRHSGFYFAAHPEKLTHLAVLGELWKGFPPRQFPEAAGLPFPAYQVFPYFLPLAIYKTLALPLEALFFVFSPSLVYLLFVAALLLFVYRGSASALAACCGGVLLFLTYIPGTSPYVWEYFHYVNLPSFYGALLLMAVLFFLCYYQRTGRIAFLRLALLAAALLFQFKGQFALVLYPALCAALLIYFGLRGEWRRIDWKLLGSFFVPFFLLLIFTYVSLAPQSGGIKLIFGHYVERVIMADLASYPVIYNVLAKFPPAVRAGPAVLIALLKKGGAFGITGLALLLAYARRLKKAGRRAELLDIFFLAQYGAFFLSFLLIGDVATPFNQVNKALLLPIFIFNCLYLVLYLGRLVTENENPRLKKIQAVAGFFFIGYVAVAGHSRVASMIEGLYVQAKRRPYCSRAVYDALLYIRENTLPEAVLFTNIGELEDKNALGAIALRRGVLDGKTFRQYFKAEKEARRRASERLSRGVNTKTAAFFAAYQVDYFLESKARPLSLADRGELLERVMENEEALLWRVVKKPE